MTSEERSETKEPERSALFLSPEYSEAMGAFVGEALREVGKACHPILAEVPTASTDRLQESEVAIEGKDPVRIPTSSITSKLTVSNDDLIACNAPAIAGEIARAADDQGGQLVSMMVEQLSEITEATGNTIDASGRPFAEAFIEMLEKTELTFDDDGKINQVMLMHPDTAAKLKPPTPEQQARIDEVIERKRKEYLARRSTRTLSD